MKYIYFEEEEEQQQQQRPPPPQYIREKRRLFSQGVHIIVVAVYVVVVIICSPFACNYLPVTINFSFNSVATTGELQNHNIIVKYSLAGHLLIQEKIHQDLNRLKMAVREGQVVQEVLEVHVSTPLEDPITVEIAITKTSTGEEIVPTSLTAECVPLF